MNDLSRLCHLAGVVPNQAAPLVEAAPPGKKAEHFIQTNKKKFKKKYGKKWASYLYGTAWKQFGESVIPHLRDYLTD